MVLSDWLAVWPTHERSPSAQPASCYTQLLLQQYLLSSAAIRRLNEAEATSCVQSLNCQHGSLQIYHQPRRVRAVLSPPHPLAWEDRAARWMRQHQHRLTPTHGAGSPVLVDTQCRDQVPIEVMCRFVHFYA